MCSERLVDVSPGRVLDELRPDVRPGAVVAVQQVDLHQVREHVGADLLGRRPQRAVIKLARVQVDVAR